MTQFEKMLIVGLADLCGRLGKIAYYLEPKDPNYEPEGYYSDEEDLIDYWGRTANILWPRTTEKGEKAPTIPQEDIDSVYRAYPTKDPNNNDRRIAKSAKDKEKIRRLLENGHTKEELLDLIQKTKEDGRWLKDFSTWLNNLPDFSDTQPEPQPKKEEYRLRW